jgi:chromosome segregation ATPase
MATIAVTNVEVFTETLAGLQSVKDVIIDCASRIRNSIEAKNEEFNAYKTQFEKVLAEAESIEMSSTMLFLNAEELVGKLEEALLFCQANTSTDEDGRVQKPDCSNWESLLERANDVKSEAQQELELAQEDKAKCQQQVDEMTSLIAQLGQVKEETEGELQGRIGAVDSFIANAMAKLPNAEQAIQNYLAIHPK